MPLLFCIRVVQAWRACDCWDGIAAVKQSLTGLPIGLNITLPALTADVTAAISQLFVPSLPAVDLATAVGQWVIANALNLPIPQATITDAMLTSVSSLLGGNFTVPSLIVPGEYPATNRVLCGTMYMCVVESTCVCISQAVMGNEPQMPVHDGQLTSCATSMINIIASL